MLKAEYYTAPTDIDLVVFEKLIPADHYLRRLKAAIDFEPLRALVADCYAVGMGAPAEDPVRMLKVSLLQFQYDLSDSQVLRQAQVNVAFRFFLDLALESALPVPSLLSQFRTRLGEERFTRVFNEILRQARAQGLVRDRLRVERRHPSDRQYRDSLHAAVGGANPGAAVERRGMCSRPPKSPRIGRRWKSCGRRRRICPRNSGCWRGSRTCASW